MDLERLDHIALVCADTETSRDWYCRILGMEWIFRGQWEGNPVFLQKGDARLALFQAGRDSGEGPSRHGLRLDHFAFLAATREAFQAARDELTAKKIEFDFQDHEISHSIYLQDPDGHVVEITTYDL